MEPIKPQRESRRRNSLIFAFLLLGIQLLIIFMYAFFIRVPTTTLNMSSAIIAVLLAFTSIAGLGLYYSYLRYLMWTSLGFGLLLVALSLELSPLINALWAKAGIVDSELQSASFSKETYNLFLNSRSSNEGLVSHHFTFGASIVGAVRCGIALMVAFGGVMGRVGELQCLVMAIVGVVCFEMNRMIIGSAGFDVNVRDRTVQQVFNSGIDRVGTYSIFTFGAFMGLAMGAIMAIRQNCNNIQTIDHNKLRTNKVSRIRALAGTLLLIIMFLLLAIEGDNFVPEETFTTTTAVPSILLAMSGAFLITYGLEAICFPQQIRMKELIDSVVAGGVVVGASTFYIVDPILALAEGVAAGVVNFIWTNWIQRKIFLRLGVITTHPFSVFAVQGFVGCVFSAGYNQLLASHNRNYKGFDYFTIISDFEIQFGNYFTSVGYGSAAGIITGLICYCICQHEQQQLFGDQVLWYLPPPTGVKNNQASLHNQFPEALKLSNAAGTVSEGSAQSREQLDPGEAMIRPLPSENKIEDIEGEQRDDVHSMVEIDYDEEEWDNIDEFDVGVADMLQVIEL